MKLVLFIFVFGFTLGAYSQQLNQIIIKSNVFLLNDYANFHPITRTFEKKILTELTDRCCVEIELGFKQIFPARPDRELTPEEVYACSFPLKGQFEVSMKCPNLIDMEALIFDSKPGYQEMVGIFAFWDLQGGVETVTYDPPTEEEIDQAVSELGKQ